MATLVADLFTDDIGINILSFLDHKTEIIYRIKLIEDKLKLAEESGDGDVDELVYKLECLYNYLNDPEVWASLFIKEQGEEWWYDAHDYYYDSD